MIKESHPMLSDAQSRNGWFKSSFSSNANQCVEVRFDGEFVSIRDSKYRPNPANHPTCEPIITVAAAQWAILLHELTGRATVGADALSVETILRDVDNDGVWQAQQEADAEDQDRGNADHR